MIISIAKKNMSCWVKILLFGYVAVFIEYNKAEKVNKFTINFF